MSVQADHGAIVVIPGKIVEVRGVRVLLDRDVAELFSVEVRKLNQQVSRNEDRFVEDFAFRMTWDEFNDLRSQNVIFQQWTKVTYPPMAFTDYGVVMAATVLKSAQAIQATRMIVKTFVEARKTAWEAETLKKIGRQLPLGLEVPGRQGLMTKLNMALGHVLDAIVDPKESTTVRDEAREIIAEGAGAIKEYFKKFGMSNDKTGAEVRRILAEVDAIDANTERKRTENKHRQLALLAKQLKLIMQAQRFAESGSAEGLIAVLSDLERP